MFTDIHSHILCKLDDGPKDFDESAVLLNAIIKDGVRNLVVTPHFYPSVHSLSQKIEEANSAFSRLEDYVKQNRIPITLLRGFEVRYFKGISNIDCLDQLSINNSNVLLLELPFEPITENCVEEILKICYSDYIVVLAHLERYATLRGFKLLKEAIMENGILVQSNAESFIKGRFKRNAFKLLKEKVIDVIASDAHSIDERPPCLNEAYEKIEKKFGIEAKNRLIENSEKLFNKCF